MTQYVETLPGEVTRKICWRCQMDFGCGALNGTGSCWCNDLPPIRPTIEGSDCLCPGCLSNEVSIQAVSMPSTSADNNAMASVSEGTDYYIEGETVVFTARYHLRRGSCCGNGCRHCPYIANGA